MLIYLMSCSKSNHCHITSFYVLLIISLTMLVNLFGYKNTLIFCCWQLIVLIDFVREKADSSSFSINFLNPC